MMDEEEPPYRENFEFDWSNTPINETQAESSRTAELRARIEECHRTLRRIFGHSGYKGKQKEIIEAGVEGRDVFVLAPTGMGKSLCFQIPAASDTHGVTLVISPLLALMKNQVTVLREKGVAVASLTSETSTTERQEIMEDLMSEESEIRLLYTTPERFCTAEFMTLLRTLHERGTLNRLAVDEAHCISEWGHDFREEYRRIGVFREKFPKVPIMALTATATPGVQEDIIKSLKMSQSNLFRAIHPFNRANLYYEVRYTAAPEQASQMAEICDYILGLHRKRGKPSCGIIYCRARKTCSELASYLRGKGLSARPYHRGIPNATLDKTLKEWSIPGGSEEGGIDVVVATIAFGLGIDNGDVRYIIHYDTPKSFEGYYQETGRAGRNGSLSKCILYYSREDLADVRSWVKHSYSKRVAKLEEMNGPAPSQRSLSSLEALSQYAENTTVCRHVLICRFFGEVIDANNPEVVKGYCDNMCDVCKYPEKTRLRKQKLSSFEHVNAYAQNPRYRKDGDEDDEDENSSHSSLSRTGSASNRSFSNQQKRQHSTDATNFGANKKLKTSISYGQPLVTKPFNSASSLRKPFKTPFKDSSKVSQTAVPVEPPCPVVTVPTPVEVPSPKATEVKVEEEKGDIVPDDDADEEVKTAERPSSPVEIPDLYIELEHPSSRKVEPIIRHEGVDSIRRAIHQAFSKNELWSRIDGAPLSSSKRAQVIATASQELEFETVLSFSSTVAGYRERIRSKVRGLKLLHEPASWEASSPDEEDEYEHAKETIDAIRRVCKLV